MLLVDVDLRLLAEDVARRVGQAIDEPLLAEVVVDHEHAVGRESRLGGPERLLGEHEALEAHRRERGLQRERIDQREYDEVVLLLGRPQIVPRIVGHHGHARVPVRPIRMVLSPQPHDDGIDLDRVDARRAVLQGRRHVRARAGAEDQHVLEAVAEHLVRPLVEVLLLPHRRHRLVEDVVHLHHGFLALRVRGDLVVRRPQRVARQPVRHAERHGQAHQARGGPHPRLLQQERHGREEGQTEPGHRRQLQRGQRAEGDDAGQAAGQVHEVGPERRVPVHLAPESLRRASRTAGPRRCRASAGTTCSRPARRHRSCHSRSRCSRRSAAPRCRCGPPQRRPRAAPAPAGTT